MLSRPRSPTDMLFSQLQAVLSGRHGECGCGGDQETALLLSSHPGPPGQSTPAVPRTSRGPSSLSPLTLVLPTLGCHGRILQSVGPCQLPIHPWACGLGIKLHLRSCLPENRIKRINLPLKNRHTHHKHQSQTERDSVTHAPPIT